MPNSETVKLSFTFLLSSILTCIGNPNDFPAIIPTPCQNQITKESGVCMFYWSCTHVAHGIHIASCLDRFLIGSCCKLPEESKTHARWMFEEASENQDPPQESTTTSQISSDESHQVSHSYFTSEEGKTTVQNENRSSVNLESINKIRNDNVLKKSLVHFLTSDNYIQSNDTNTLMRQFSLTNAMKFLLSLKKSYNMQLSANIEPTHDMHKPVALEAVHDMRNPVALEAVHDMRNPVALEAVHDSRKPVVIDSTHDLRKPVSIELLHDLRNPITHKLNSLSKPVIDDIQKKQNYFNSSYGVTELTVHGAVSYTSVENSEGIQMQVPTMSSEKGENTNQSSHDSHDAEKTSDFISDTTVNVQETFSSHINKINDSEMFGHPNADDLLASQSISIKPATDLSNSFNLSSYQPVSSSKSFHKSHISLHECGISPVFPSARIVGGKKANYLRWPWMISLHRYEQNMYKHKCGAVLLNKFWALTVAHCVDRKLPNEILLHVGDYNLHDADEIHPHQEMRVYLIIMHPDFNPYTFENDLALLRFYQPVPDQVNIAPVCLPSPNFNLHGKSAVVTGWGRISEEGELPGYLQEVYIPILSNEECQEMYMEAGYFENITEAFLCAAHSAGGLDACEGDSGGPMVVKGVNGQWFLVGLISWGMECGAPNVPGVYTRVQKFVDWIEKFISI